LARLFFAGGVPVFSIGIVSLRVAYVAAVATVFDRLTPKNQAGLLNLTDTIYLGRIEDAVRAFFTSGAGGGAPAACSIVFTQGTKSLPAVNEHMHAECLQPEIAAARFSAQRSAPGPPAETKPRVLRRTMAEWLRTSSTPISIVTSFFATISPVAA
jgi:hypothetical protein